MYNNNCDPILEGLQFSLSPSNRLQFWIVWFSHLERRKKKKKCFFAAGNIKMFNSCCTAFRPPSSFVASRILFETLCFYSSSFASIFLNLHPPTPFSCCLGCRHVSFILSVVFSFQRLLAETFIYDVQKLFKYCTKKKKEKKKKKTCWNSYRKGFWWRNDSIEKMRVIKKALTCQNDNARRTPMYLDSFIDIILKENFFVFTISVK